MTAGGGGEFYFYKNVTILNVNLSSHIWLVAMILDSRLRNSRQVNLV